MIHRPYISNPPFPRHNPTISLTRSFVNHFLVSRCDPDEGEEAVAPRFAVRRPDHRAECRLAARSEVPYSPGERRTKENQDGKIAAEYTEHLPAGHKSGVIIYPQALCPCLFARSASGAFIRAGQLFAQNFVFFEQVVYDCLLLRVQATRTQLQHHLRHDVHSRLLSSFQARPGRCHARLPRVS